MGADRLALYEKIYRYIRGEIESGRMEPGSRIPTERELTKQFGVSRITTSRALSMLTAEGYLNRRPGVGTFVGEPMSSRGAGALHDIPSPRAESEERSLLLSSDPVGFIIPWLKHTFGPVLVASVEKALHDTKQPLCVACSYGSQQIEQEAIGRLVSAGATGLIIFPVNGALYNSEIVRLHVDNFPIVLVDKRLPGLPLPSVSTDNVNAAKVLTEHLLELGHRHIAFYSPGIDSTSTLVDRYEGYCLALSEANVTVNPDLCVASRRVTSEDENYDLAQVRGFEEFLKMHPEVTAVLATDDELAEYCLLAAVKSGKRVPDDLSIACFDGPQKPTGLGTFTCMMQDEERMGEEAVRVLRDIMENPRQAAPSMINIPARFRLGNSTSSPQAR